MKFYYLLLLFAIIACTSETEDSTQNAQSEIAETVSDINEPITELKNEAKEEVVAPDSLVVPTFMLQFDFSEKVQKILNDGKEHLVVDLVLSGIPADESKLMDKDYYSDEDQQVYLKNIEILYEQNEAQTMTIENLKISKEALNTLKTPNYTVGLNFYSSRTSSDNNIFSANALIEEVNVMKNKTHTIKVKLL